MKKLSKIVSLMLSLALCLGMASPAFAASFSELQGAINTGESVEREGYKNGATGADRYKIEASKDEKTGSVNVKLWEGVTYGEDGKTDDAQSIIISKGQNVTLDLNGNNIDGGYDAEESTTGSGTSVVKIQNGGSLTLKDNTAKLVTETGADGETTEQRYESGKVTGGNGSGGVCVLNGGNFTMESGAIEGNNATTYGGGVQNSGSFTMNGGTIRGNTANCGGGIFNQNETTINGGTIEDNIARQGGGIYQNNNTLIITGGTIQNNTATNQGGGFFGSAGTTTISNANIKGNSSHDGGGILNGPNSSLTLTGVTIEGNTAHGGGGIHNNGTVKMTNGNIVGNTATYNGAAINNGGKVELSDVAISKNQVTDSPEPPEKVGIITNNGTGNISLKNTTFSENSGIGDPASKKVWTGDGWSSIKNNNSQAIFSVDKGTKLENAGGGYTIFSADTTVIGPYSSVKTEGWVLSTGLNVNGQYVVKVWDDSKTQTNGSYAFTLDEGKGMKDIVIDEENGTVSIPAFSNLTSRDTDGNKSVITYPEGAVITPAGQINGKSVTKAEKDGGVDVSGGDLDFTVRPPKGDEDGLTVEEDGSVDIGKGGVVDDGKTETTYPDGGKVNPDGTVTGEGATVSKDKETGDVTIKDSEGSPIINVDVPGEKKDEVDIEDTGTTKAPGGSSISGTDEDGNEVVTIYPQGVTIDKDGNVIDGIGITVPGDQKSEVQTDDEGSTTVPPGGKVTDKDGNVTDLPFGGIVRPDGSVVANPDPNAPVVPPADIPTDTPAEDTGADTGDFTSDTTTIADQEVPLAGLVSREILISYLYVQAGSPDGEDAEGEYTKALAWAIANGIIDQESDPEEVVTVAILRDVMTRYARFLDVIFDVEIPGEDDEIVMNCDEILEKFFASQEDKAA